MYPDAYLNYYADRYIALRLGAHGVGLEQYLGDPDLYEHLADEPEPLLPAQRAVAARLAAYLPADDEHDALSQTMDDALAGRRRPMRGAA
jgi:hypothetical protein